MQGPPFAAGSGIVGSASRSVSVSLFSGLGCSVLSLGRAALFRLGGRFDPSLMVSFRPSGPSGLRRTSLLLGLVEVEARVASSTGPASHPPSRDRTGRRMRPYAAHYPSAFHDVLVRWLTCPDPPLRSVTDVSPRWGGRATDRRPRVKAIGSKTATRQGRCPVTQPEPSQRKRRHYEHEARSTTQQQRCDPPPFETEQRNHPRRHHLPDRVMLRRDRDARLRGGHLGPVGCDRGTVTPRNSSKHKH